MQQLTPEEKQDILLQDLQQIDTGYCIFHCYPLGQDKWNIMYKFPVKDTTKYPIWDNWWEDDISLTFHMVKNKVYI